MNILESDWFFSMVKNHGRTPRMRLLAVFTIAGQWISAPGIRESFRQYQATHPAAALKAYMVDMAASAGARDPTALATQLVILLQGAIAEELRDPASGAMENAGKAAHAVVCHACQRSHESMYRVVAAGIATMLLATVAWLVASPAQAPVHPAMITAASGAMQPGSMVPAIVNPREMETVLHLQEKFKRGVCPVPHLLALPPGQMTAYMNVVQFRTPDDPEADRVNLHAFLAWYEQTRAKECYYAPENGHTLVKWRAS